MTLLTRLNSGRPCVEDILKFGCRMRCPEYRKAIDPLKKSGYHVGRKETGSKPRKLKSQAQSYRRGASTVYKQPLERDCRSYDILNRKKRIASSFFAILFGTTVAGFAWMFAGKHAGIFGTGQIRKAEHSRGEARLQEGTERKRHSSLVELLSGFLGPSSRRARKIPGTYLTWLWTCRTVQ